MLGRLVALALLAMAPVALAQQDGYLVQPGDRLEISVLEDPGLNRTVLVRPDGRITLPLVGTVNAEGQTPEAVAALIRRSLARDFVEAPTVTVALSALGTPMGAEDGALADVYVIGAVSRPGAYQVVLPMDALQILALAGGPGVFAAESRIQVRRRGADGEKVFLLDYDSIQRGLTPSTVIDLADGDVVVVPERGLFE
jgi:polysaccharide export outer membrane protein